MQLCDPVGVTVLIYTHKYKIRKIIQYLFDIQNICVLLNSSFKKLVMVELILDLVVRCNILVYIQTLTRRNCCISSTLCLVTTKSVLLYITKHGNLNINFFIKNIYKKRAITICPSAGHFRGGGMTQFSA